jgi:hypothetical protein
MSSTAAPLRFYRYKYYNYIEVKKKKQKYGKENKSTSRYPDIRYYNHDN